MSTQTFSVPCVGGLNVVDPALSLKGGEVIYGENFEITTKDIGYKTLQGYERFDGRPAPSEVLIQRLTLVGAPTFAVGDVITGATSAATGTVVYQSAQEVFLSEVGGVFSIGETVNRIGIPAGTVSRNYQATYSDVGYAQALIAAQGTRRQAIQAVPGSGPVRGVWLYNDVVYAFRDDVTGSRCQMYKSSSSGWQQVALGSWLDFGSGTTKIAEEAVITGVTSGATATVKRVSVFGGGKWGGPTSAKGRLVVTNVTGTFQSGEIVKVGGVNSATLTSALQNHSLAPGGKFEFANHNFFGASNRRRMYGVDGKNMAFEFDGTTFAQIGTGMADDKPTHLSTHKNYLWLTYTGGSLQRSGVGTPLDWNVLSGAGEITTGDDITCLVPFRGDAMLVCCSQSLFVLYGNSPANFTLSTISLEYGAKVGSAAEISGVIFLASRLGLNTIQATQNYGSFDVAAASRVIRPILDQNTVAFALLCHAKTQYRLLMTSRLCLTATFLGQTIVYMLQKYAHTFVCGNSCTMADGREVMLVGDDQGYVFTFDRGTSFDGLPIRSSLRTAFVAMRSYSQKKRFRKVIFDMQASHPVKFSMTVDVNYGRDPSNTMDMSVGAGGGYWDVAKWDQVYWDAAVIPVAEANIDGVGQSIGMLIYHESATDQPISLNAMVIHYSPLGMQR